MTTITCPTATDVLSGRGNGVKNWPGNVFFREQIKSKKNQYILSPVWTRGKIIKAIIETIQQNQSPPGRFLKQNLTNQEVWEELTEDEIVKKIGQALREGATEIREQSKTATNDNTNETKSMDQQCNQQENDHHDYSSQGGVDSTMTKSSESADTTSGTGNTRSKSIRRDSLNIYEVMGFEERKSKRMMSFRSNTYYCKEEMDNSFEQIQKILLENSKKNVLCDVNQNKRRVSSSQLLEQDVNESLLLRVVEEEGIKEELIYSFSSIFE